MNTTVKEDIIIQPKEDVIISNDNDIVNGNLEDINSIWEYEKSSPTIEKELEAFKNGSETIVKKEYSLDELSSKQGSEQSSEQISDVDSDVVVVQSEMEDFLESADFVIMVVQWVIIFGTNFYLKSNDLEKITIKDFNISKSGERLERRAWARVLQKYNLKTAPEFELIIALGSVYGTKIKGIVSDREEQKRLKELKIKEGKKYKEIIIDNVIDIMKGKKNSKQNTNLDIEKVFENDDVSKEKSIFKLDKKSPIIEDNAEILE